MQEVPQKLLRVIVVAIMENCNIFHSAYLNCNLCICLPILSKKSFPLNTLIEDGDYDILIIKVDVSDNETFSSTFPRGLGISDIQNQR